MLEVEVSLKGIILDIQSDKAGTLGNSSLHKYKHTTCMHVIASKMPQLLLSSPLLPPSFLLENQNLTPCYFEISTAFLYVQTSFHMQVNMEQTGQAFSEHSTAGTARLLTHGSAFRTALSSPVTQGTPRQTFSKNINYFRFTRERERAFPPTSALMSKPDLLLLTTTHRDTHHSSMIAHLG